MVWLSIHWGHRHSISYQDLSKAGYLLIFIAWNSLIWQEEYKTFSKALVTCLWAIWIGRNKGVWSIGVNALSIYNFSSKSESLCRHNSQRSWVGGKGQWVAKNRCKSKDKHIKHKSSDLFQMELNDLTTKMNTQRKNTMHSQQNNALQASCKLIRHRHLNYPN